MNLTISIVNWNVKDYLEKCLESIYRYSDGIDFEIVVVDNASRDGSVTMVKEKFPRVMLIKNKENIGYGCAHNQVMPIAKGRYILFLNPDTEMLSGTLPRMIKFMDIHPEAGACKCRTVANRENTSELIVLPKAKRLLFAFYKCVHSIIPSPVTAMLCSNIAIKAIMLCRSRDVATEQRALEGGALLVRMGALRQAGAFDPEYLLGGEGADLTRRIRKLGWKLYRIAAIKIVHYRGKCTEGMKDDELIELETNLEKSIDDKLAEMAKRKD